MKMPWNKPNPKAKKARKPMTKSQVTQAKTRAAKAGRPYPNLVDNLAVRKIAKKK